MLFQSRSGFSLRCDLPPRLERRSAREVSIPFWVFSPLRRSFVVASFNLVMFQSRSGFSLRCDTWRLSEAIRSARFNPVLGFLSVATGTYVQGRGRPHRVSIPFWVFSPLRQDNCFRVVYLDLLFQSRSGFSLRCDTGAARRTIREHVVSIPFWVFSPLRHEWPPEGGF